MLVWPKIDKKEEIMRKGAKLVICPECGKKGLIRNNSRLYIYADCRYCKHHVKAGWAWNVTCTKWMPIKGREEERKILDSF